MANNLPENYYNKLASKSVPEVLSNNKDYQVFLELLGSALYRDHRLISVLDNAYNVDLLDDEMLPKLADTLEIDYPITFSISRLRLLLKYYNKIIRNRGSLDSIQQMLRILEATEEDIAMNLIPEYNDLEITEMREGSILIEYDGITEFEFARKMLRKVRPAGYEVILANKEGPVKYKFDSATHEDRGELLAYSADSDSGQMDIESARVDKNMRYDSARVRDTISIEATIVGRSDKDSAEYTETMTLDKGGW